VLYQPAKFSTKKSTHFRVIAVCVLGYFYGAPCIGVIVSSFSTDTALNDYLVRGFVYRHLLSA